MLRLQRQGANWQPNTQLSQRPIEETSCQYGNELDGYIVLEDYSELYLKSLRRSNVWIIRCIAWIASFLKSLRWKLKRSMGQSGGNRDFVGPLLSPQCLQHHC